MYETARTFLIAREMKAYNIGLFGLSETRWLQSGQLGLVSGETLLYSGHPEEDVHHTEGVALMLTPIAQKALIGWKPISSRIISAKFTTKRNLHIVQCYAPTNDAEEEIKDGFYQQLQAELDNKKTNDITILMGDFNAKIGADNKGYEEIMGTHGIGQINENGERFADLCALNQMVIGGSIFPHKNIYKVTWRSPDHTTENQNYVL
ncbi:craniofacial development protein 2 [Elysia marginata]|uniref:Craniofacial development protein 2 n=1 Tax=Elysia marginata TaxID=1093978 RepID=A0AAV4HDM3_9GAST|nr:craniofacial development protein 2 [Elysia marginata]